VQVASATATPATASNHSRPLRGKRGYTLRVSQLATPGFTLADFSVHIFDLAAGHGIEGLVGLSFERAR
jgi:hypothetical protein